MAFLDKMGKFAKTVGEKTGDAVEIGRLNLKISQEEKKIEEAKIRLGDLMYLLYRNGRTLPEDAAAICLEIKAMEEAIVSLEAEKEAVCADKPEPAPETPEEPAQPEESAPEVEPDAAPADAAAKVCPGCQENVAADAKFCGNCGYKF